jgi:hypothetical protein
VRLGSARFFPPVRFLLSLLAWALIGGCAEEEVIPNEESAYTALDAFLSQRLTEYRSQHGRYPDSLTDLKIDKLPNRIDRGLLRQIEYTRREFETNAFGVVSEGFQLERLAPASALQEAFEEWRRIASNNALQKACEATNGAPSRLP